MQQDVFIIRHQAVRVDQRPAYNKKAVSGIGRNMR